MVLTILASACQPSATPGPTSTIVTSTTTIQPEPDAQLDRLVVSTLSGAVVVYDTTGNEISRVEPPSGHFFGQPTWLDDATIVFSDVSDSGDHALTAADAETGSVVWRAEMETPPFYFSPAPVGGSYATTSLRNDPSGAGLVSELVDRSGSVTSLSAESPFYTSWSPGGDSLAIHIPGQHLDVHGSEGDETILTRTGVFQTPVWIEMGLVTLRTVGGTQKITIWADGSFEDIAEVDGPVGFVASGDMVAIQARERPDTGSVAAGLRAQTLPRIPSGRLVVIDLAARETNTVSNELALLYQWDEAGDSLLYSMPGDEPQELVWSVWRDGASVEIESFVFQAPWFRSLVPFFDQYAQSVLFWSSHGDRIAYPAIVGSDPVVVIKPIDGGESVVIPAATWVAWAPSG